jgi:tetratricopeptide (TPR) repeat protein
LDGSQKREIERGWKALAAGDPAAARSRAARAGQVAPAELLAYQTMLVAGDTDIAAGIAALCEDNPGYAAAWITLSVAAERSGDETTALGAARRGADLWSVPPWTNRVDLLYERWVTERIADAEGLLAEGDAGAALGRLESVLALDPTRTDASLLEARSLVALDRLDEADDVLTSLPADPGVDLLLGQIAESRGDWQAAMDSYSALPADHPDRSTCLRRAQTRWRMSVLPAYAQDAVSSLHLTRAALAVVVVSSQPALETLAGGTVPVMSDIVDLESQREIITVVRLGIMDADRLGHLFHPDRLVDVDIARETVERVARVLGFPDPEWCAGPDVASADCVWVSSPPSGPAMVSAILGLGSGVGR